LDVERGVKELTDRTKEAIAPRRPMLRPIERIPFNRPQAVGAELEYVLDAIARAELASSGRFSEQCAEWLEETTGARKALLVHSATAALEMTAILLDLEPGDEVIMPSFTFVSTANAVALRGAIPVFVDIRPDTLNIDESIIEDAITPRTNAVIAVHYAGVPCEMDAISEVAERHWADRGGGCGPGADVDIPRATGGRARRCRGDQLPRDEEPALRRGWGAARQAKRLGRARCGPPG
jgi:hypothetical protein